MSEERNNNMKSKELKAIIAGVAQALNTTLDELNKDEQETETFDNTDDLFESWEEPDLRRLAEDAYNDWLDSPAGISPPRNVTKRLRRLLGNSISCR